MKVRDIMSTKVQTIDMNEKAETAWNLMKWKRIHHVVVTDGPGQVVGVISARDLGGRDREDALKVRPVAAMMTAYAVKAIPEMPVRQAANVMRGWNIGCLPVVESGKLVGIVTVSDLLRIVAEGIDKSEPAPRKAAAKKKRKAAPVLKKTAKKARGK
ncbi:MAG TPA: CBS domain-containing protein [Thermoanaerobaculia bacterium]|nr:CBS domain-containing protein [Thermoanaerobaculia bacterium]